MQDISSRQARQHSVAKGSLLSGNLQLISSPVSHLAKAHLAHRAEQLVPLEPLAAVPQAQHLDHSNNSPVHLAAQVRRNIYAQKVQGRMYFCSCVGTEMAACANALACLAGFQAGSGPPRNSSMSQEQDRADGKSPGANDSPWLAHSFQQGKIPEMPPPPEVC